jgi:hypothetical protein
MRLFQNFSFGTASFIQIGNRRERGIQPDTGGAWYTGLVVEWLVMGKHLPRKG